MDPLDDVFREAIQQLPAAFESRSDVPPSYRPERIDENFLRDENNITLLPRGEAERGDESTADDELVNNDTIAEFELANSEAGFEASAFYISFHNCTEDRKWGIFYYDDAVRALATKIKRDLGITDHKKCARLAIEILRKHELFHFRLDLFALQQELTLRRPLYNRYARNVYRKVLFTKECYEESLANASSISGWSVYQHLAERLCSRSFYSSTVLNIEDFVEFTEIDEVQVATVMSMLNEPSPIEGFVRGLCKQAPPGYCDFDRDPTNLRAGLGGQLLTISANKKLQKPQASWVGRSSAFADRDNCPEYLLISEGDSRPGIHRIIVRNRGEVWEFHKYDVDPWPSKPHGHNRESGEKLDLASGWIYDRSRNPCRKCTKKELAELRATVEKRWPNSSLPPLVWAGKAIALG